MKRNYLLIFIIFLRCFFVNAQSKISFNELNSKSEVLNGKFKTYKILEINDSLERISDGEKIIISLDQDYSFTLKENRIHSNDYIVSIKDENGIHRKTLDDIGFDGKYFSNKAISANNQFIFSMFENRYSFYIKNETKEFYIEPLKNTDKLASSNQYVYYEVKDIIQTQSYCDFKDENNKANNPQLEKNIVTGGCKNIDLIFFVDYTMYATYGNINAAINRTFEVLNLSQINYTIINGLSDDVTFKVREQCIITCETCNFWPTTLEIGDNFNNFQSNFGYYSMNFQSKIKVLFQNEGGTGDIVGLASPFLCNSLSGITAVKNYAANSDLTRNILSHEIGHNLGCVHTSGFIMNPSVNYSTNWAPESILTINDKINTLSCITNCNPLPCDGKKAANLLVTSDTVNDQITISWLAEPGIVYKMQLYNYSTNTLSSPIILSFPTNSITFPISQTYCTDRYRFKIVPQCDTIEGIAEHILFNVSQNVASPTLTNWTGFVESPESVIPYSTLCTGKVYYTSITGIDGGTNPIYQWKVNGINVGTNSNSLTISSLQNNDVLSCLFTSNSNCVDSPSTLFSTVVSTINPVPLTVTIQVPITTICAGQSITLNQTVNQNSNYESAPVILLTKFNGTLIDTYTIFPNSSPFLRTISFTPSISGFYQSEVFVGTNPTNGNIAGCHMNSYNSSTPIYITVIPQPCNLTISDFDILGLNYYPNPVNNNLIIQAEEVISNITIYSLLGQELVSKEINTERTTCDLSSLTNGTYFLKINANDKIKTVKIIKQ